MTTVKQLMKKFVKRPGGKRVAVNQWNGGNANSGNAMVIPDGELQRAFKIKLERGDSAIFGLFRHDRRLYGVEMDNGGVHLKGGLVLGDRVRNRPTENRLDPGDTIIHSDEVGLYIILDWVIVNPRLDTSGRPLPEVFSVLETRGDDEETADDALEDEYHDQPLEAWLAERDAEPPDPHPCGPLVDRMLASGWDFVGFHDSPVLVRGFLDSVRPLSELEMTLGQRRYWRVIKRRFRGRLQGAAAAR